MSVTYGDKHGTFYVHAFQRVMNRKTPFKGLCGLFNLEISKAVRNCLAHFKIYCVCGC